MTLTFRDEQSADLTPEQVDENFRHLLALIENLIAEFPGPTELTGAILQAGLSFQMALSDATFSDPVTLQPIQLALRGDWQASTSYSVGDLVRIRGTAWYFVNEDHVSGLTFDSGDDEYDFFMVDNTPSRGLTIATDTLTVTRADHLNRFLRFTHVSGCDVTFDDLEWVADDEVHFRSKTAGPITFTAASGMTLDIPDGFDAAISTQGGTATAKFNDEDLSFEFMGLLDATSV